MTDTPKPLTADEIADLLVKAKAATPGEWRQEYLGGCSTVLLRVSPQAGDTRAASYAYRDEEYCVAYPFKETDTINGPGQFRWDFVCFSHENAAHIVAAQPLAIQRLIATIEQRDEQIEKLRCAVQNYGRNGHFDTCQSVLITDAPYPCNCGYQDVIEALAQTEPKP